MIKGNMYKWIDRTWNPIRGQCPHNCHYCFVPHLRVRKLYEGEPYLAESSFRKNLGCGYFYFICDCFDLMAKDIPSLWIIRVLDYLKKYEHNKYLLQTKNPIRYLDFLGLYPEDVILGTTIETHNVEKPTTAYERASVMDGLKKQGYQTLVSIEPILKFNLPALIKLIRIAEPSFVSIGADSKNHHLPEPSWDKVEALIKELEKFTEVRIKPNLYRLKGIK